MSVKGEHGGEKQIIFLILGEAVSTGAKYYLCSFVHWWGIVGARTRKVNLVLWLLITGSGGARPRTNWGVGYANIVVFICQPPDPKEYNLPRVGYNE